MIRNATLEDAPALAHLMTILGYATTEHEMVNRLQVLLRDSSYHTIVAVNDEGQVVGMCGMCKGQYYEKNGCYVRLVALVVDANWRGKGIGQQLAQATEVWGRSLRAITLLVNTNKNRTITHRFYQRLGFENTGLRFVKPL